MASDSAAADAAVLRQTPPEAPAAVPPAEFKERVPLMFKLDAAGPTASGRQPGTRTVTKGMVQTAWWAVNEYCDDRGPALC